jgi:PAS domain S-box-containing protein
MKKRYESPEPPEPQEPTVEELIGLGHQSARKNYYSELTEKLEELEAERNRYKWLFDNALHGIFQADLAGTLRGANPAMANLCAANSVEFFQERVKTLGGDLFYDPKEYLQLISRLQRDGKVFRFETRLVRVDGAIIYVSMNALLKQEADDTTIEAFVQDITDRVNDQIRLRKLNEELEERVMNRTNALAELNTQLLDEIAERAAVQDALEEAKEQAIKANVSKDKYLAAASHDLLQPLNAARLLVATLRERTLAADEAHLVDRTHVALESAEELLTDLLDISKLDQNAVQADCSEFHLSQLLNTLRSEFEAVAESQALKLIVRDTQAVIKTDARLLMRILRNFVSNAMRYTETGGVLVGARARGDHYLIEVWDTGEGIPLEQRQAIFREFNQLPQHRNGERKGVGLGLAIVERIARVLNLKVDVSSSLSHGSVFRVWVPKGDAKALQSAPIARTHPAASTEGFQGQTVLVVDNEPDILLSMRAILTQWGIEPVVADSAETALELLQSAELTPDAYLLDYHLNDDQTAADVMAALAPVYGDKPTAIITAERHDPALLQLRRKGVQILNKPVKPGKLRALLTHMLRVA